MKKPVFMLVSMFLMLIAVFAMSLTVRAEAPDIGAHDGYIVKLVEQAQSMHSLSNRADLEDLDGIEGADGTGSVDGIWNVNGIEVADETEAADGIKSADGIGEENGFMVIGSLEAAEHMVEAGYAEYFEPNYYLTLFDFPADGEPNDPYYAGYQWNLRAIEADLAWKAGQFGQGAKVAVIDSGLYQDHQDIDPLHVIGGNNYNTDGNPYTKDLTGHGSFVSGIIAARTDNGLGLAGIVDEADMMPLRCFSSRTGATVSMIVAAINDAVAAGCDVINMSFGMTAYSETLKIAVDAAAAEGVILVAAAGNDGGSTVYFPAGYDSVIGVGSVDNDTGGGYVVSSFSQRNATVFVTAPGGGVAGIGTSAPNAYELDMNDASNMGTSYSAPVVSALAAIVKSVDKDISPDGFKTLLINSSVDLGSIGYDASYGYGLVNAGNLVEELERGYSVSFSLGGGFFPDSETVPGSYHVTDNILALPTPARAGSLFAGWYEDAAFTGEAVTAVSAGSVGNRAFWAKWITGESSGSDLVSVSVSDFSGTRKTAVDGFDVLLPAGVPIPTDPALIAVVAEAEDALVSAPITTNAGVTWLVDVTANNGIGKRTFIISVGNSSNHAPVVLAGMDSRSAGALAAYPGSLDGRIAAVPYTTSASIWFADSDVDDVLTVSIVDTDALGMAEIVGTGGGTMLRFTPAAGDAGKTVAIRVRAQDSQFYSGSVTLSIGVGALPISHSVITPAAISYDLYAGSMHHGDVPIEAIPYGNTLIGLWNGDAELIPITDYVLAENGSTMAITLKNGYLSGLSHETYGFAFKWSRGNDTNLSMIVMDSAPRYTVTFFSDGVYAVLEQVRENDSVVLPNTPVKSGYSFGGWYTGQNGTGTVFTSSTLVHADMTLQANWTADVVIPSGGGGGATGGGGGTASGDGATGGGTVDGDTVDGDTVDGGIPVVDPAATSDVVTSPAAIALDGLVAANLHWLQESAASGEPVFELFRDVRKDGWYAEAVQFVSDRGLFSGTGMGAFSPQAGMTRGMFVTVLGRLAKVDAAKQAQQGGSVFTDLRQGAWYAPYVLWASGVKLVMGVEKNLYKPDAFITREQMACILYRFAKWAGLSVPGTLKTMSAYPDASKVSSWARDAMSWATGAGLVNGKSGGRLDPQGISTRAEVAVILQRFILNY